VAKMLFFKVSCEISSFLFPGYLYPPNGGCMVALGSTVTNVPFYDVAVGSSDVWLTFTRGMTIPRNAVHVGFTAGRQDTYACRNNHSGSLMPGSVEGGFCFIASGASHRYENFELLTDETIRPETTTNAPAMSG
jgi:hypothetical protein